MDASSSTVDAGYLTISEVCEKLGLTYRAVRFYETQGMIAPKRKIFHRYYHTTDLERLRAIIRLKSLGLSLREIKDVLQSPGDGPYGLNAKWCEEIFERLSVQRAEAEAGLAFLRDFLGCRCGTPNSALDLDVKHGAKSDTQA